MNNTYDTFFIDMTLLFEAAYNGMKAYNVDAVRTQLHVYHNT